ncbi:MAG: type II secretion system protein [Agathobacter sp.]|nr:type II secretion system protein [Agathobacter sp.]
MKKNEVKKNNKGFSLVELIVVIAIMAVLVGVLAPQFIQYVEKSRESTDVQNIQQIITAIETYAASEETELTGDGIITTAADKKQDLVLTDFAKKAVKDAGLSETPKLKSDKWTKIKISYNSTDKKWIYEGVADYYKIDGDKKTSTK